ncbi:DUF3231 family protein [Bacillus luteolus]|uniref:DUF3231 family protein n=1 Tax=Litchfieldia luteola TaxID=682179 RepID=A0ABR9QGW6_9BACI|nr:DUF3231 family protein [Cytobacillus luteolus]MBE4907729.1 DUF3231 family protein [Cytobacillus luteolus]MBP1944077.1 hypothetical protein [Cytobacillus luteolus]
MGNPIEAVWNLLKTRLDVEPKSPLHVIEVGDVWKYLAALEEFIRYEEIGLNTTVDDEIKEVLTDAIKQCESQAKRLSDFLTKEGIPLPNTAAAKPVSDPNSVPLGVKLTDDEIANGLAFKFVNLMMLCGKGQGDCLRNDLGLIWVEFYTESLTFGTTLKTLMRKRGWLKVPPYYYPPGNTYSS